MREVSDAKNMATASTPARSRRPSEEVAANASRRASQAADASTSRPPSHPASRAASPLDQTVRYSPPDPLRLFSSGERRDCFSLIAAARRIAAAGAPLCAPTPQSPSSAALRQSHDSSPAERRAYAKHTSRAAPLLPPRARTLRVSVRARAPSLKKSSPTSSPTSPIR